MIPLIQNNITAIRELCKKHHVSSLYLFGSAATEYKFDQQSDVDFLYEIDTKKFENPTAAVYDYVDNLSDLEHNLSALLLRKIDLIPYQNIKNKFFKKSVDESRQLVYARR